MCVCVCMHVCLFVCVHVCFSVYANLFAVLEFGYRYFEKIIAVCCIFFQMYLILMSVSFREKIMKAIKILNTL